VLWLNLVLVDALVVVGVAAHSFAVLAEGDDFILDAAGVGVGILAIWLSTRQPQGSSGGTRFTDMAAALLSSA
jgi:Co/Zn/Cd efflux system component